MSSSIIADTAHPSVRPMTWRTRAAESHRQQQRPVPAAPDMTMVTELQARFAEYQQHAESRIGEAQRNGFKAGVEQGRIAAEAELHPLMQSTAAQLEEFRGMHESLFREAEQSLVDLAFAITRRILHRELTLDPAAVCGIVASALHTLKGHRVLRVRVHPRLETHVRAALAKAELLDEGVELTIDRTLGSTGLVFETERGDLDASVETQLDEIRRGLTDGLTS